MKEPFEKRPETLPYRKGVGLVVINSYGLVLVGESQRLNGIWKMPQGGIEPGEKPEAAAFRELREETGITKAILLARSRASYFYDYPAGFVDHMPRFRGQELVWFHLKVNGDARVNPSAFVPYGERPEFKNLKWVAPQDVIRLAHHEGGTIITLQKQAMYRLVLAELGLLENGLRPTGGNGKTKQTLRNRFGL